MDTEMVLTKRCKFCGYKVIAKKKDTRSKWRFFDTNGTRHKCSVRLKRNYAKAKNVDAEMSSFMETTQSLVQSNIASKRSAMNRKNINEEAFAYAWNGDEAFIFD